MSRRTKQIPPKKTKKSDFDRKAERMAQMQMQGMPPALLELMSSDFTPRRASGKTPDQILNETLSLGKKLSDIQMRGATQEIDEDEAAHTLQALFSSLGDMFQNVASEAEPPTIPKNTRKAGAKSSDKQGIDILEKKLKFFNSPQHVQQNAASVSKTLQECAKIYKKINIEMLAAATDPIATAICSSQLFIQDLLLRVDVNKCYEITDLVVYLKKQGVSKSESLQKELDRLCSAFNGLALSAFDNYELKELEQKYDDFKKEKIDLEQQLKALLPGLHSSAIKKARIMIQKMRDQIIECFPQYLAHEHALRDFLRSQDLSRKDEMAQRDLVRLDLSRRLFAAANDQKDPGVKLAIEGRGYFLTEFYEQFYQGRDRSSPLSYAEVSKQAQEMQQWVLGKAQALHTKSRLKELEGKLKDSPIQTDIWQNLDEFKGKFRKLEAAYQQSGNNFGLFLLCCEACKKEERFSRVEFLFNALPPKTATQLVNQTSTPHQSQVLSPFQCAVESKATKIANWMLKKCDLSLENLTAALKLVTPFSELANTIEDKITSVAAKEERKRVQQSPLSTSTGISKDSSEKKITLQQLQEKKAELDTLHQKNKDWPLPLASRLSIEEHSPVMTTVSTQLETLKADLDTLTTELKVHEKKLIAIDDGISQHGSQTGEETETLYKTIQDQLTASQKLADQFAKIPVRLESIKKEAALYTPSAPKKPLPETKSAKNSANNSKKAKKKAKQKQQTESIEPSLTSASQVVPKTQRDQLVAKTRALPTTTLSTPKPTSPTASSSSLSASHLSLWKTRQKDDRLQRQATFKIYCDFKPSLLGTRETLGKLMQYNALLFQIFQYMETQKKPNALPAGYAEKISAQLGIDVFRMRNALVHSFTLLSPKIGNDLDQELKEVTQFANGLATAMQKQEFGELKSYAFGERLLKRGKELEEKFDAIDSDSKAIEHILYLSAQQLQFATVKDADLPKGMVADALSMVKIRLKKYFPESAKEREEINHMTHLTSLEDDPQKRAQTVVDKLETTFSPRASFQN